MVPLSTTTGTTLVPLSDTTGTTLDLHHFNVYQFGDLHHINVDLQLQPPSCRNAVKFFFINALQCLEWHNHGFKGGDCYGSSVSWDIVLFSLSDSFRDLMWSRGIWWNIVVYRCILWYLVVYRGISWYIVGYLGISWDIVLFTLLNSFRDLRHIDIVQSQSETVINCWDHNNKKVISRTSLLFWIRIWCQKSWLLDCLWYPALLTQSHTFMSRWEQNIPKFFRDLDDIDVQSVPSAMDIFVI